MDEIDKKIINALKDNARISTKELAQAVYLSAPAVRSRMERLEDSGIISGYSVNINQAKLGYLVKAYVNVEMDPKLKPKFYPFVESCPNVLECDCVTGQFSMHLKVAFKTMDELDTFINHIQEFGSTSTQVVFSTPLQNRNIEIE